MLDIIKSSLNEEMSREEKHTSLENSCRFCYKTPRLFFRRYVKGRDFYDLVWYLGKGILPNFVLLNNAIAQTEGKGVVVTEKNFGEFLLKRLENIDFAKVRKDVERFLVDKEELRLLDGELIRQLLLKKKII